jgi:hypothetical protein
VKASEFKPNPSAPAFVPVMWHSSRQCSTLGVQ